MNEALLDAAPYGMRPGFWFNALGAGYIDDAFRMAHAADPSAKLFYNDYAAEGLGGKSNAVYALVQGMLARGVPIHGVGLQAHFTTSAPTQQAMSDNIRRLGQLGLEVHITELDVRLQAPFTADKFAAQAEIYARTLAACRANANCTMVTIWGVSDLHSWIPDFFPGFGAALLFNQTYGKKTAYNSFATELAKGPLVTQILDGGVVIHAAPSAEVSPGSLADIYGARMASSALSAPSGTVPTTLGNTQVKVNGVPAPLLYVSADQIVFQIPYETPIGIAQVVVINNGVASLPASLKVKAAAPFILTYGANRGIVQNEDYSLNATGNCAKPGSYLVAYLMGAGPLDNAIGTGKPASANPLSQNSLPTVATVGGKTANVTFSGMTPGFLGLMQMNFQVPDVPDGDHQLFAQIGTEASNRPLICVAR